MILELTLKGLVVLAVVFHLVISPYTKVEESFNLQAIHDILNYGVFPFSQLLLYDHKLFPGAVPRTFVGSLLVSVFTYPIVKVLEFLGVNLLEGNQFNLQLLVRAVIGVANALLLISLGLSVTRIDFQARRQKRRSYIGVCYLFLLLSQFHILYYASRTLPNFMALPFVNYALAKLIRGEISGFTWLAFTAVIFRLEVGVFAVSIAAVFTVGVGQADLLVCILLLAVGSIAGGFLLLIVDSQFWGYIVLPELTSLKFNVLDGKAANWGVEPFHAYFSKYIYQLFRPPVVLVLCLVGLVSDPANDGVVVWDDKRKPLVRPSQHSLRALFFGSVLYILIMSLQPHKEWRFIIYTVPVFTVVAANGLDTLMQRSVGSLSRKLFAYICIVLTVVGALISVFLGYISSYNYPGGYAIQKANELAESLDLEKVTIHLDVAACMSGVSRFGELHSDKVVYDKSETPAALRAVWNDIDILVSEVRFENYEWEPVAAVSKFSSFSIYPYLIIWNQYRSPWKVVQFLGETVWDALQTRNFKDVKMLIDAPIVQTNYLFIYERVSRAEVLDIPIIAVDLTGTEDADIEEVVEEINEQIDNLEN